MRDAGCDVGRRSGEECFSLEKPRMIIIDGNSLVNRAFYALPPLTTKQGLPTNAVYGFITMLFKILEEYNPDYISVAFDRKEAHLPS
jgi:DNA polymerase-1